MAKPRKVEEAAGTYYVTRKKAQKKSAPAAPVTDSPVRYAKAEDVRTMNAKLMQVHRKVLQKLAQ